jgi:hypothetical protein
LPEVKWKFDLPADAKLTYQAEYNYSGVFLLSEDGDGKVMSPVTTKGSCHYSLYGLIDKHPNKKDLYFWISTTYNQHWGLTHKEMEEWFKFTLDPATSPWGALLNELEYSVVRERSDKCMNALVMKVPDINTVALFHMFKGIRGIREQRALPFLLAKKMGVTDLALLYKIYVLSSYFHVNDTSAKEKQFIFSLGMDHQPFKKKLNANILNKRMVCDLHDNNRSLLNTHAYYGSDDMPNHVFGCVNFPSVETSYDGNTGYNRLANRIREQVIKSEDIKAPPKMGYYTNVIERVDTTVHRDKYLLNMKHFIEQADTLWEILS